MMLTKRSLLAGLAALAATPAIAAPGVGGKAILVAGQSLAVDWKHPAVADAFRSTAGPEWDMTVIAKGGTSALFNPSGRCWTAEDGGIGPVLAMALAHLRGLVTAGQNFNVLNWSQGQADGVCFNLAIHDPEEWTAGYSKAVLFILESLRKVIAGDRWRSIPVMIQTIGWRRDETGGVYELPGYMMVRLAQTMLVQRYGARHNLHLGPVQTYWDELRDPVHPTIGTHCRLARHAGLIAKELVR